VLLGGGYGSLAVATFVAVVAARVLSANRLVRNQAAAAAILTVALADGQAGLDRLLDALIGAGTALVFTQILFSPEPVALVRRAEAATLTSMGDGMGAVADALDREDDEVLRSATDRMRDVGDHLNELGRAMLASGRVVRHSILWRSRRGAVDSVTDEAGHLHLLGPGCLLFIRTAIATGPRERALLRPPMRELACVLTDLARARGDVDARQRAVDRVLDVTRGFAVEAAPLGPAMTAAVASLRMVAFDVIVYAGVGADQAATALGNGSVRLRATRSTERGRLPRASTVARWFGRGGRR
jgi:hypothetical protein